MTAAVIAALVAGCADAGGGPAAEPGAEGRLAGRPADGLLTDQALRDVVDLQVARDAPGLVERLGDPDPRVRARAAFALGSVQAPDAVPALLAALDDRSPRVRADAAFALGQAGAGDVDAAVATALLEALDDEPVPEVRRALVEAIGKTGGPEAVDALALYRDPRLAADVVLALSRAAAVRSVATDASVERAGAGLTHPDPEVRMAAAYLVGRTGLSTVWYGQRRRARGALRRYGVDDPAAMWLVQGLGRVRDASSRDMIDDAATESPDWRVRTNGVATLAGRVPDGRAIDLLIEALDDPSPHVRITAAEALAEFPMPPSVAERVEAWIEAHPDDWRTTGRLAAALAVSGDQEFVIGYLEAIPMSDLERWRLGVEALGFVGGEGAVRLLHRLLASPHAGIAREAMTSLVNRFQRDRLVPATHETYWALFRDAVTDGDPLVVYRVAPALADSIMVARGGVELLMALYERMGEEVGTGPRAAVLEALGEAGDPAALPLLRRELRSRLPRVREAAGTALVMLEGGSVALPTQADVDAERRAAGDTATGAGSDPSIPDFVGERIDWDHLRRLGPHPLLHLETEKGGVVVRLDAEEAPMTVQTVAALAEAGKYDGVRFHRVVPNFVIQTGDFVRGDGTGDPGFDIGSELTRIPYLRGVIGMASSGKDTEGSQFFVTHSAQPHLDGGYTSFGYVVEGMDVVDRILIGDRITRAWIEPG